MPVIALSVSALSLLAHAGENHEETAAASNDLLTTIGHQPFVVSLLICVGVLAAVYGLLSLTPLKLPAKLLGLFPAIIILGIFYLQHNPSVTTVLLSVGFIGVFLLAFTMLKGDHN